MAKYPDQPQPDHEATTHAMTSRPTSKLGRWPAFGLGAVSLIVAACIWLPLLHTFFRPDPAEYRSDKAIPVRAIKLAKRHISNWQKSTAANAERDLLRACNPEWDLMSRGYLVLSLANMSLREPASQEKYLDCIDRIIDDTLAAEREHGQFHFLLPYAQFRPFVVKPARSFHVDSQIGLMLAARCMIQKHDDYLRTLRERVDIMQSQLKASPVLAAESYPDECWTFDIVNGLAVTRMCDALTGTDHAPLRSKWLAIARDKLVHPETGLLVSSFTVDGRTQDGPEGSSIWMAAHGLQLIDEPFARDQYQRAHRELSHSILGFGYASEWPRSWVNQSDIDSGPQIPILEISAGASGMALIAASAFDDDAYLSELMTTLDFAAFPHEEAGALRYCASNEVGDAVMLYSTVLGPLWERVKSGAMP